MPRLTPALLVSILLHAGLIALAFVAWPGQRAEILPGAVPVSIVSDIARQAAPAPEPSLEPVEETPLEAEAEAELEAEVETPQPPAEQPASPRTPPREEPRTPQRPAEQPRRPQPREPTPPRREEPSLDLDAIAGGGGRPGQSPDRPRRPAGESGSGDAPAATGQQTAALGRQVIPHWNINCAVAGDLSIRMRLTISSNGRITDGPTLIQPQSGSVWRAAAEAAMRAARAAAPYEVPDGYRTSEVVFRFETAEFCRGR